MYYAKHTPHKEGAEPVLMMLSENLEWIQKPDIRDLNYDFDGRPAILFYDGARIQTGFYCKSLGVTGDEYDFAYMDFYYVFNSDFSLDRVYIRHNIVNKIDIKDFSEYTVKEMLYDEVAPIVSIQKKPIVNLQWLFDIVYKDKFN